MKKFIFVTLFLANISYAELMTAIGESNNGTWTIETCSSLLARNAVSHRPINSAVNYYSIVENSVSFGNGSTGYRISPRSVNIQGPSCKEALIAAMTECIGITIGCKIRSSECGLSCQHIQISEDAIDPIFDRYQCNSYPSIVSDDEKFSKEGFKLASSENHYDIRSWPNDSALAAVKTIDGAAKSIITQAKAECESRLENEKSFSCYQDKMNGHLVYNGGWSAQEFLGLRCWVK